MKVTKETIMKLWFTERHIEEENQMLIICALSMLNFEGLHCGFYIINTTTIT